MTLARVLLTLSGFLSVVNGLIEFGPETRPATKAVGAALVLAGLVTWALVGWMGRPRPAVVAVTAAATVAIAGARVAQFAVLHSPAVLLAILLPAVALWRVARSNRESRPTRAVLITAGVLVVITGAALAAAVVPSRPGPAIRRRPVPAPRSAGRCRIRRPGRHRRRD